MTTTTDPHEIRLVAGIYMCLDEGCNADECCDEDRCSNDCVCNTKPDDGLTTLLSGKMIYQVLTGHIHVGRYAEPATILEFTDGTSYTIHHET